MKIGTIPRKETPTKQPPLLPLSIEDEEIESHQLISHSLRVDPANANSPTFKKHTRILDGSEDVRSIIMHPRDIEQVCYGLAANNFSAKIVVARRDQPR